MCLTFYFFVSCFLLFSQGLFFLIFQVAIVLDIMEGQWRGRGPKMAKMSYGVKPHLFKPTRDDVQDSIQSGMKFTSVNANRNDDKL